MHLNCYLPAEGFEICIYKIKLRGRHALCGIPKRVEVSGRPRANDIMGLKVLAMVEVFNPTSGHASEVLYDRVRRGLGELWWAVVEIRAMAPR